MDAGEISRPSLGLRLLESRAVGELYLYAWMYPLLHLAPKGDGHPVLVLPGFLASGRSTFPLRHILKRVGYRGHRWKLGRNMGQQGLVADIQGETVIRDFLSGKMSESEKIGVALADRLLGRGAKEILDYLKANADEG